ncbi:hypothetical protein ABIF33_004462 [Bradyrhizobium elkanii]|uniref:bestrophin-like domain n=1 Tax=Bradyrhizobium elkanii TaxID=29448 RepID=UPI0035146E34
MLLYFRPLGNRGRRESRGADRTHGPCATRRRGGGTTGVTGAIRLSLRDALRLTSCSPRQDRGDFDTSDRLGETPMSDWLHNLSVPWMAFIVFGFTYLVAILIFAGVAILSTKERATSFKSISPGMLPVLGILFGLFVAFTAAQVWSDSDRATAAVSREASSLRAVILLAGGLPPNQEARLRGLVRDYVEETVAVEWPMMARQAASLKAAPAALTAALRLVVSTPAQNPGQQTTQHEIITNLNSALDARRQRIIVSQTEVDSIKWWCLYLQAICELLVIALVHCDNRLGSAIAMGLFATGVATSVLLIAAHDRPFTGQISIAPTPLLQIMPDKEASR